MGQQERKRELKMEEDFGIFAQLKPVHGIAQVLLKCNTSILAVLLR